MTTLRPLLLGLTLLMAPAAGSAPAPAAAQKPGVSIASIEAQVYDRQKGAVVAMDEVSDPYGMNVDAFITVKVQGTYDGNAPLKLRLVVSAPKESSEAGESPGFKVTQTRELQMLSENGVTLVPFLLNYSCASKVKVVATLTGPGVKGTKTLDTSFPCAE